MKSFGIQTFLSIIWQHQGQLNVFDKEVVTDPMFINHCDSLIYPKGYQDACSEAEFQSLAERLSGILSSDLLVQSKSAISLSPCLRDL